MLLKDAVILLVSRREHSIFELRQKLRKHSDSSTDIDTAIEWAVEQDLVDESRFAESRVMHRWNRGYGPLKVISELRMHQMPAKLIDKTVDLYDWQEALSKSCHKCRYDIGSDAWKRVMISRGFRYDDVTTWLHRHTEGV